jgi:hypothetical protein
VLAGEGSAAPSSRKRLKVGETAGDTSSSSRTASKSDGIGAATSKETCFGKACNTISHLLVQQ